MASKVKIDKKNTGEISSFEKNSDVQLQEKVAIGQDLIYSLTADKVYGNHLSEMQKTNSLFTPCFIP